MERMRKILVLFVVVLCMSGIAGATVVELTSGTEDATLALANPDTNYGSDVDLMFGNYGSDAVIKFDMSSIPAGATINSATLSLYRQGGSGENVAVYVGRVTNSWVESEVTYNSRSTGVAWDSAGGDSDMSVWGAWIDNSGGSYINFTGLADIVQTWFDGSAENYGFALLYNTPWGYNPKWLSSSETIVGALPILTVDYIPEPATVLLLGIGGGLVILRKRKVA